MKISYVFLSHLSYPFSFLLEFRQTWNLDKSKKYGLNQIKLVQFSLKYFKLFLEKYIQLVYFKKTASKNIFEILSYWHIILHTFSVFQNYRPFSYFYFICSAYSVTNLRHILQRDRIFLFHLCMKKRIFFACCFRQPHVIAWVLSNSK